MTPWILFGVKLYLITVGFVWSICDQSDEVHKFEIETLGQYQGAWYQRKGHIIRG